MFLLSNLGQDVGNTLGTNLFKAPAESFKHSLHVSSLLHGYDPGVVLLVYPDEEILLIVMPAATTTNDIMAKLVILAVSRSDLFSPSVCC